MLKYIAVYYDFRQHDHLRILITGNPLLQLTRFNWNKNKP